MAQISTSNRGGGVGVKVMNAIKSYADQKGLPITIYKVTNQKFFDKFEWLEKTGADTYEYSSNVEENFADGKVKGKSTNVLFNLGLAEGYKLQLERDKELLVLNITDTKTGKRTEVRGKPGYETGGYDPTDSLHILLDKVGKSVDISQLMNGEPVGINPKHPKGDSAKAATDKAYSENFVKDSATAIKLIKKYHQTGNEQDAFAAIKHGWNFIKNPKMRSIIVNLVKKVSTENGYPSWDATVAYIKKNTGIDVSNVNENFADGKVKGKSRPGRVKKSGASCDGSVTELRAKAKKASGEKAKMYHWCANMKAGKKK